MATETLVRDTDTETKYGYEDKMDNFQETNLLSLKKSFSFMKIINFIRTVTAASIILLILIPVIIDINNYSLMKKPTKHPKTPIMSWNTRYIWWIRPDLKVECMKDYRLLTCAIHPRDALNSEPDAYLFYAPSIEKLPLPRTPEMIWGLLMDESPTHKYEMMHEKALNLFNFSSTFSRQSDLPFPLVWVAGMDAVTNTDFYKNVSVKNSFQSDIAPVIYLQSDCDTPTERDDYVRELMEFIKVDAYGSCLYNKDLPLKPEFVYRESDGFNRSYLDHIFDSDLMEFIGKYKFIISIENAVCNDYVTEKFWRAIEVGTVPIYYGSPLIRDWLPNNKSAILLEDFPTPELLSRHLHYLLSNDTAYEEYLEHKTLGLVTNQRLEKELAERPFQLDLYEVARKFECLVCERLHDTETSINIVTKEHFDCPKPASALTLDINPDNPWLGALDKARVIVDNTYKEIANADCSSCMTNTVWL